MLLVCRTHGGSFSTSFSINAMAWGRVVTVALAQLICESSKKPKKKPADGEGRPFAGAVEKVINCY